MTKTETRSLKKRLLHEIIRYGNSGMEDKALECSKHLAKLDPSDGDGVFNCGVAYEKMKQYEKAILFYKMAIRINPKTWAYTNIAHIYDKQKKYTEAIEWYQRQIQATPLDPQPYTNIGNIYFYKLDNPGFGIALLERAVRLAPRNLYSLHHLGWAYYKNNDAGIAAKIYLRLIKLHKNKPALFTNYYDTAGIYSDFAIMCLKYDELDEAAKAIRTADRITPTKKHKTMLMQIERRHKLNGKGQH